MDEKRETSGKVLGHQIKSTHVRTGVEKSHSALGGPNRDVFLGGPCRFEKSHNAIKEEEWATRLAPVRRYGGKR